MSRPATALAAAVAAVGRAAAGNNCLLTAGGEGRRRRDSGAVVGCRSDRCRTGAPALATPAARPSHRRHHHITAFRRRRRRPPAVHGRAPSCRLRSAPPLSTHSRSAVPSVVLTPRWWTARHCASALADVDTSTSPAPVGRRRRLHNKRPVQVC